MADVMDFNKECCLCLHIFTDPRVLPCLHTFCLKCLENMGSPIPNDWLLCPVCGSKFTVPEEDLTGLPKNIFAEKLTDVRTTSKCKSADDRLCDACARDNLEGEKVAEKFCIKCEEKLCLKCCTEHEKRKEHLIVDLSSQKEAKHEEEDEACQCRVHQEETLKMFCTFCKKVICDKCFHESHSSHSCSDITDVVNLVCKQAEKEYNNVENMQHKFQDKRETLHREHMKFLEKVKKMETEVLQRCEEIKELVIKETKALLQQLAALKKERLEQIEMESRRIDKYLFTLEKFKDYCVFIKSNRALNYTCEADCILRNTAKELRIREESRIGNRIFPLVFELQKTSIPELMIPISSAIGKLNVICSYNMKRRIAMNLNKRTVHGMASLQEKLYVLSDSVLVLQAVSPYNCILDIKTPDIKSPTRIVSCCQTSRLYIYDKGNACIWKVSVPDNRVTRWCNKVKEPCTMSVTHNGEVLMIAQSENTNHPVTVEIYNQNAILTESLELPKDIQSLQCIYKIASGNYLGLGEQHLYKFRADGSTVCKCDIPKHQDSENCVRRLEVSPYHIFLISTSECFMRRSSKVSQISYDLAVESDVLAESNGNCSIFGFCYVKATKTLAVLELEQDQFKVKKGATPERKAVLTIYAVF